MGMRSVARFLALVGVVLACIWGVAGPALASASIADAAFAVSENGTIHVSSTPSGGGFSISGPEDHDGTAPAEYSNVVPGTYTIVWEPMPGYRTPEPDTATITEAGNSITFTGNYVAIAPETGTVRVTSNPNGAGFTLTGPGAWTRTGTAPETYNDAPVGSYNITWNAMPGYNTPISVSQLLTAGNTIEFRGQYTLIPVQEGTITVNSIPGGASFTITGAAIYIGTAPATYANAPLGSYTIAWGLMLGYNTPPNETKVLTQGGGISFTGNYEAVPQTGTIVVTANMPGAAFDITGAATYDGALRTIVDAPAGSYTITWRGITGMSTPVPQTLTLLPGGTITFNGLYIDNIPPSLSGVAVKEVTTTTATITWTTNEKSDSQVEYGLTIAFGFTSPVNANLVTSHSLTITGLKPGTWYYYRVTSRDQAGNPMQSERFEFLTSDDTPPVISSVIVTDISESGATVKWETDERSDSQVEYGLTGNYGSMSIIDSSLLRDHSVALSGLAPQTTYHYRVKSTDYWGNSSVSPDATFTTVDIDAPVISGVAATGITDTSVIIVWFTDAPSDSSVEYGLTTNYGLISTYDNTMVTSHSVALPDLMAQTTYHYKVKSRDASGLWSQTPDYTFTTGVDMGSDPPQILFLTPGEPTSSGATISWSTNEMATSQVEYGLTSTYGYTTAAGTEFKTLHSVQLTGLKSGMTYHYRVICTDAAGNRTVSGDKTFATPMGRAPLPSLPAWAWAIVGVAGVLLVGVLVVKNR